MPVLVPNNFLSFNLSPSDILANRKIGQVYVANFNSGQGKYISVAIEGKELEEPIDLIAQISPKVEVRFTYLFKDDIICGVQISKLTNNKKLEKIHLSTLDWNGVLKLLSLFNDVDVKPLATGSLILDKSLVSDPNELLKFLNTIATDPEGNKKLKEVAKNFKLLSPGDIDFQTIKKENSILMHKLLNDKNYFDQHKEDCGIGKDEEVWQQFFTNNDWLVGSDVVQVLEERNIDEESRVDLPVRSTDGFLDVIELKLPTAPFWTQDLYPNSELTKALIQCMRYLEEYERRSNDYKKIKELGVDIIKPRVTLIYGRSLGWDENSKKQFRILNSSFHNITVLTYDHILQRAFKLTGIKDSP